MKARLVLNRNTAAAVLIAVFTQPLFGQTENASVSPQGRSIRILNALLGQSAQETETIKCGLPAYTRAVHERSRLTGTQNAALAELDVRPVMQTSVASGGFRFHFDTTGSNAPALLDAQHQRIAGTAREFVDSALAIMKNVYDVEINGLGFLPPPSDGSLGGGGEYDIYIMELGYLYGQTIADNFTQDGSTSTTFMEIDNDFIFVSPPENKGIPGLEVTLAHEFHHAIQIGSYGFWTSDVWFHEITSVWMEDVVYTNVNDYYNYLFASWSHFHFPQTQLSSNDLIMYSRGIWDQFLAKKFGRDIMRKTWEAIKTSPPLPALDKTLSDHGSRLSTAFAEWALWNYHTGIRSDSVAYYPEGRNFPLIDESVYQLPAVSRVVTGTLPCLSSSYYRFVTDQDTLAVIVTHLSTSCPGNSPPSSFSFTITRTDDGSGYRPIGLGYLLKLSTANPSDWLVWNVGESGIGGVAVREGLSFPSPFLPGIQPTAYFALDGNDGTLTIYSSSMELVYSSHQSAASHLGQRVLTWDGRTSGGELARSGVYIFVLNTQGRSITGKIAVVRR